MNNRKSKQKKQNKIVEKFHNNGFKVCAKLNGLCYDMLN